MPLHSSSRELCSVLQCTPQSLQNDCVRMLPAVLWRYRAWIDAGTEVGMEKICHRHDDSLSRPLMVCALEGGAVQTLGANAEGGSGEGESGRRPGTAFLVDAAHCGCCMWCMPHATCIISSILNSVAARGGVVGAGLSDDSKHHASLTMLSSVSMSSPLRSLCCASVGDRMSRRATRPQSR